MLVVIGKLENPNLKLLRIMRIFSMRWVSVRDYKYAAGTWRPPYTLTYT